MMSLCGRIAASALALGALWPFGALAQNDSTVSYPNKAVTLIIPYPPGGTTDVVGRQLAQRLSEELGQNFIPDNKPGAATTIGATAAARAPKDGYTLLLSAGTTFTVVPHMQDKLQYKLDDFEPVAAVCTVPFAFVVRKDFPANDLGQFIAYAKANPGKVDSNVEALTSAVPNVSTGRYRALAVLSSERLPLMPNVPTFRELGYPSIVGETWFAIFAPAGTPKPVVDKLNTALRKITTSASFAEAMRKIGNEARSSTPAELGQLTLQQSKAWG